MPRASRNSDEEAPGEWVVVGGVMVSEVKRSSSDVLSLNDSA